MLNKIRTDNNKDMEKKKMTILTAGAALAVVLTMASAMPADNVITKENGMTVINTTSLTKKVRGYMGPTPVKIYIKGKKIVKVEALSNQETPKFFALVKKNLLGKWNGKSVKQARKLEPDCATGATFSSKAVIKNVQTGLDYYRENGGK